MTAVSTLAGAAMIEQSAGLRFDPYIILANVRRLRPQGSKHMLNWVLAMEVFGLGSGRAQELCRFAGIDPNGKTIEVRHADR